MVTLSECCDPFSGRFFRHDARGQQEVLHLLACEIGGGYIAFERRGLGSGRRLLRVNVRTKQHQRGTERRSGQKSDAVFPRPLPVRCVRADLFSFFT